jgi:hypothetical protein
MNDVLDGKIQEFAWVSVAEWELRHTLGERPGGSEEFGLRKIDS